MDGTCPQWEDLRAEAYGLGFGEPIGISAEHSEGLIDMFELLKPFGDLLNLNKKADRERYALLEKEKALEKEEHAEKKESSGRGSEWYEKELSAMTQRDWRIMREDFEIKVQGARAVNPLRFWREAPIHPAILRAVEELGCVW